MFEGFAGPQIAIPWDQTGLMIDLYIISLFWNGILEFSSDRMLGESIVRWFSFRWGPQVSLLSSVMPKYLISFWTGMGTLFIISWGHSRGDCFNVKATCTDFSVLILIFHFLAHLSILLAWSWSPEQYSLFSRAVEISSVRRWTWWIVECLFRNPN